MIIKAGILGHTMKYRERASDRHLVWPLQEARCSGFKMSLKIYSYAGIKLAFQRLVT